MQVIPAIDLKDGRCVRLMQGEFDREVVYSRDPANAALYWQEQGADRLHLVDLDGAREGEPQNLTLITEIVGALAIPVQLGGGIRTLETVEHYLQSGVDRVILGTAALKNPQLVEKAVSHYGADSIVVGIDARRGMVAVQGWLETSRVRIEELIQEMIEYGVKTFIYTDISRDGMLQGPDIVGLSKLQWIDGIELIASGGITALDDLEALSRAGIDKAIVGKALYTGDLNPDFAAFRQI